MKRPEAEALVKRLGGSVKSAVAKGLSYLVTNDPLSGSSKNEKARSLGVPILDEAGFLALAEGVPVGTASGSVESGGPEGKRGASGKKQMELDL